jgi:hypothetical protein
MRSRPLVVHPDLEASIWARASRLATLCHLSTQPPDRYPRSAARLLLAMSRSHSGWSAQHVDALLLGFGFEMRDSGAHTFYRHPDHPRLALAVPRTRRLRPYVVADAVRMVGVALAAEREDKK